MSVASPWGPVRLTTLAMAVLAFALVALRTRRPGLAAVAVIACLWTYEAVWNATDIAVHGWGWAPEPYWLMLAAGWTGWMLSRGWVPGLRLLAVFAVAHLAWVAAGFPYNYGGRPWTWAGEAWNAATKTLWLLAWGLGSERLPRLELARLRLRVRRGRAPSPSTGDCWDGGDRSEPAEPATR